MNHCSEKMRITKLPLLQVLAVMVLLWAPAKLSAQGWEYTYGNFNYNDRSEAILQTEQTGFLIVGTSQALSQDQDNDAVVTRIDIDGEIIWQQAFDAGFIGYGTDLAKAHQENVYVLTGYNKVDALSTFDMHLVFFNERGEELSSLHYGSEDMDEFAYAIIPTTDGGYLLAGRQDVQARAVKVDGNGNELWAINYTDDGLDRFVDVVETGDGYVFLGRSQTTDTTYNYLLKTDYSGSVVWGYAHSLGNDYNNPKALIQTSDGQLAFTGYSGTIEAYTVKVSSSGQNIIWQSVVSDYLESQGNDLVELQDGSIVVGGVAQITGLNSNMLLVKYAADGSLVWQKDIGNQGANAEFCYGLISTFDGGFAATGDISYSLPFLFDILVAKSDAEGNTLNSYIRGQVFEDLDFNCLFDSTDAPQKNWAVKADGIGKSFYAYTDENGFYEMLVDTGIYQVSIIPPAPYWQACDAFVYELEVANMHDTLNQNFGIYKEISCPWLEVDMSSFPPQACQLLDYQISCRNRGTTTASAAYVDVILDKKLQYIESDIPPSLQVDSLYRFELGDLPADADTSFNLRVFVACDVIEEQAIVSSAHIYPDSICLDPQAGWDGSRITVNGWCEGGTTYFNIQNIGPGDMAEPMDFIVIEDEIMGYQEFQLPSQASLLVTRTSPNGATFRLIADQAPELPGFSRPNVAIEGCSDNGPFSTGKVLQFPEDEFDPFRSVEAQETVAGLSANGFQLAFPKGYRGDTIAANQDIEYTIVFYNGTSETVDRVYIRDTISDKLDFTSIQMGASNFPYLYEAYDQGILKIKFNDINLLPGGYGFVKFHIKQQPDLPQGTEIFNRARLSVGYEGPEIIAEKRHVIGGNDYADFVQVVGVFTPLPLPFSLHIYPNPGSSEVVVKISGEENFSGWLCHLFDAQGRKLASYPFENNSSVLQCEALPTGMYFVLVTNPMGKLMGMGKLSLQKP